MTCRLICKGMKSVISFYSSSLLSLGMRGGEDSISLISPSSAVSCLNPDLVGGIVSLSSH